MAKGVNKVILLGNVGKAPEVRVSGGGTTVATFSLATQERVKQGDAWADKTEWHNCVAFGRTAEIVRDYVGKGAKLYLEGKIQTRSWDDRESGKKNYRTEVVIHELNMLDPRPGARQGGQAADDHEQRSNVYDTHGASRGYADQGATDEDVPF